jgi:hypothetical protein
LSIKEDLLSMIQEQDVCSNLPPSAIMDLMLRLVDCGTASFVMPNLSEGNMNRLQRLMATVRSKCQGLKRFKVNDLAQGKVRYLKQLIVRTLPSLNNLQVVNLRTVQFSNPDLQLIAENLPNLVYVFLTKHL